MRCARCGECCKQTLMELSEEDISRLTGLGYVRDDICIVDVDGITRLRNVHGGCFFLSKDEKSCTVYAYRPKGCSIYPVNCDPDGNVFTDEFCKARGTVSKSELRRKGIALRKHLEAVDEEARARKRRLK